MADNSVFITGVNDGAFEKAFGELPGWATQDTLFTIEGILKQSLGIQTKTLSEFLKKSLSSGNLSPADIKRVNDELAKLDRNIARNNEEFVKTHKRNKDLEKDDKEKLKRGRKLETTGDKITYVLTGLATAGTKVAGVYSDYVDVYDSMYQSGINMLGGQESITDGFESLNHLVNETGLRLETLQKVAEKYASTVNVVGFVKFGKATAKATRDMEALGYSQEASAEFIANMMEAEQGYSNIRGRSADRMAQDAVKLAGQMDKLSKTVGMSREQLAENLKASGKTANMAMVAAKLGDEAAARANANMAGLDDQMRDVITKMLAFGNPALVKEYSDLVAGGSADIASSLERMSQLAVSATDPAQFMQSWKAFGKEVEAQSGTLANYGNLANQGGEEAANMFFKITQQGKKVTDATDEQLKNGQKTQASIARWQTQLERSSAILQAAFFPLTEQVNLAASALKGLNDVAYAGIKAIEAETRSWVGIGIAVAGFIAGLVLARGALTTFASLFGASSATASTAATTFGTRLLAALGPLALLAAAFTAMVGVVAGVDSVFGMFGKGNKPIDKKQDDTNWDRMTALQKAESGLARGIEKLGSVLFMNNLANEAAADRIRSETEYFRKKDGTSKENQSDAETARLNRGSTGKEPRRETETERLNRAAKVTDKPGARPISVPTTPMASTIDSPSAIDTETRTVSGTETETDSGTSSAPGTAIEKPASKDNINNLLSYQGDILAEILISTNSLVSVNRDILRYARNNA